MSQDQCEKTDKMYDDMYLKTDSVTVRIRMVEDAVKRIEDTAGKLIWMVLGSIAAQLVNMIVHLGK
jgi:hypothetical protein